MIDFASINMDANDNLFRVDAVETILGVVTAQNPDASQEQINGMLTTMICGELRKRKSADGVRNTLWRYSRLIAPMRSVSPECHDQILLEFADRITSVS